MSQAPHGARHAKKQERYTLRSRVYQNNMLRLFSQNNKTIIKGVTTMKNHDNRVLKLYHWLIFALMGAGYGLYKYGFSFKALFTAWAVIGGIAVYTFLMLYFFDKD